MKNFSILIASWNNLDYLKLLLRSIEKNSCYDHEVIVHVQEGTDGTLEWCRENNILHTHSESNVGISQAVNNCFSKATKDWICHMDDDMYVCPEWDKKLLDFIHENKLGETAWVASTMIEPRGDNPLCITPYSYGSLNDFDEERLLDEYGTYPREAVNNTQSNPLLLHRSLWEKMGGADEKYFGPGFEEGLSKNAWDAGCRTFVQTPDSRVYHFQSTTMLKLLRENPGSWALHRDLEFYKDHGISIQKFNNDYIKRGKKYDNEI
tara:strand:- start:230 stop:1021 length:792 start_codon:yes stop_codon:yes gene_type:complete